MLLISKDKRFYSASLPEETVKFSDASEACVCIPICLVAYKRRLNPPKTSTKEGVKFSDSFIAIFTAADIPKAAIYCD